MWYGPSLLLILDFLVHGTLSTIWADSRAIAVIYPDLADPYRQIFETIIAGIEDRSEIAVIRQAIKKEDSTEKLKKTLSAKGATVVIGLGRLGIKFSTQMQQQRLPAVFGAVNVAPDAALELSGISLVLDAGAVFKRLKELVPQVRRVTIVYNSKRSSWVVDSARKAAPRYGLVLDVRPVVNLRGSAAAYKEILKTRSGQQEAIWITRDSSIVDKYSILPMILTAAWNQNLIVFSTNPVLVRRGALFALFPDNFQMGRALAELAQKQAPISEGEKPKIFPLDTMAIAVNRRTAEHLNLRFTSQQRKGFDFVFPQP